MKQQQSIKLHAYWRELFADGNIPERSAIEPMAIRDILGDTFILEFEPSGNTVYRLAGTRLCAAYGGELKATSFTRMWAGKDDETIANILDSVGEENVMALIGCSAISKSGRGLSLETLILPLLQEGEKHKRLLGITTPVSRPYWLGMDPISTLSLSSLRIIDPALDEQPFNTRFTMIRQKTDPVALPVRPSRRVKHLTILEGGRSERSNDQGLNA